MNTEMNITEGTNQGQINRRRLGKTELQVSNLGFGCMRLPVVGNRNDQIDEEQAISMIRKAIDAGVNYVDTAYPYHGSDFTKPGMSETLVGKALSDGYREKVVLATKLPTWLINSRADMDRILDEQLKRLDVSSIDIYLAHNLISTIWPRMKELGLLSFFDEAKKDGRIKHTAFSFHDTNSLFNEILESYDWEVAQIQYNYLDINYQAGRKGLKAAHKKDMGVVIMEPLRGGFLVNNIPGDLRQEMKEKQRDWSPVDWAFRWLWDQPEVGTVLSGMSNMEQVEENLRIAATVENGIDGLDNEDLMILEKVRRRFTERIEVNCTACGYCSPCPEGVNIPKVFSIYNEYGMTDEASIKGTARMLYNASMNATEKADNCIGCQVCETKCPQHIPIHSLMPVIEKTFAG